MGVRFVRVETRTVVVTSSRHNSGSACARDLFASVSARPLCAVIHHLEYRALKDVILRWWTFMHVSVFKITSMLLFIYL
jgi:hypothetical protein